MLKSVHTLTDYEIVFDTQYTTGLNKNFKNRRYHFQRIKTDSNSVLKSVHTFPDYKIVFDTQYTTALNKKF